MSSEWCPEVGERVAVYYGGGYTPTVRYDKVERLTKTQIILAGGDRFRVKDLTKTGDAHGFHGRERLVPVDSPEAERARSHKVYAGVRYTIENLLRPKTRGADSCSAPEREAILREIIEVAQRGIEVINTPAK